MLSGSVTWLRCPRCSGLLRSGQSGVTCVSCSATFPVVDGIPDFVPPEDELSANDAIWADEVVAQAREIQYELGLGFMRGAGFALDVLRRAVTPGSSVLDVGTGTGHFTAHVARGEPESRVFAFDVAWEILRPAHQRLAPLTNVCLFRANSRLPLPVEPRSFDVVLVRLAPLGPSGQPQIASARELLRPGGLFVSAGGAHDWSLSDPLEFAAGFGFDEVEFHTWRYERVLSPEEAAARSVESAKIATARGTLPYSLPPGEEQVLTQTEHLLVARLASTA